MSTGVLARVGIVAAIVIGGFVFRDRLTGAATELRVGDCFDEPAANVTVVSEVQHRPCNETHDAEVVFVGDFPSQDTYPGEAAFDEYAYANCVAAFEAYLGRDFESDTEFDMGTFYPVEDGWQSGDHEITCYVVRLDGQKLPNAVKAGA